MSDELLSPNPVEEIQFLRQEIAALKHKITQLESQPTTIRRQVIAPAEILPGVGSLPEGLSTTQTMLQQVADSIPLAIFWQDTDGYYLGCNHLGAAIAGLADGTAIIGKTDSDLAFSHKQAELFAELNQHVLATGTSLCHSVHTLVQPDGRQIWLDISKAPLHDESGQIVGVATAYEEITERLLAQATLQQQWEFLHQLVDTSPDLILVQNWNGQVLLVNQTLANFWGTEIAQILGNGAAQFFPPGQWQQFIDENQEVIISGEDLLIPETAWVNAQGQTSWLQWIKRVLPLPGSEELGVLAIATDITKQKQARAAISNLNAQLQAESARYRNIYENFVVGIFQTTPEGQFLSANPALARIYGYKTATELIANCTDIAQQLYVEPARRQAFIQQMQAYQQVNGFEAQIYRRDRSIIWISESARAVYNSEGNLLYYEGTVEDITARKQAEAALAAANDEISRLNEQLKAENRRMGTELEVTRQLQQMILPRAEELQQIPELDIAGFMEPATEVGGDYYDVLQQNGRISIGIGDVTGHGLESGVVMLMAQTALRTLLIANETDPIKRLEVLNQIIYTNTRRMKSTKSMTLSLLEYEAGMLYLSGQHEELVLVRRNGQIETVDTFELGFPLGIESDITPFVGQTETSLAPGEVAVLYTDGITEAINSGNKMYGLERLYQVLQRTYQLTAAEIRQAVIADVYQHIGEQRIFDDLTLVVIKQRA